MGAFTLRVKACTIQMPKLMGLNLNLCGDELDFTVRSTGHRSKLGVLLGWDLLSTWENVRINNFLTPKDKYVR